MDNQLLRILLEAKDFVSGEEMSHSLGVSRSAIWKQIKKLKELGYRIESVNNKGYKIMSSPEKMIKEELMLSLGKCSLVEEVFTYDTVDSTNLEAKRKASTTNIHTGLFVSEEQTGGKGRRGKNWVSNNGEGIYMSLLLRPSIQPINASKLTLVAGLAVQRALYKNTGMDCKIKWPNDLVLNGKKICGILTEMSSEIEVVNYVVIGIGINVNNDEFSESLKDIATSLRIEAGANFSRKSIFVSVIHELEILYTEFLQNESLDFIIDEYNQVCINVNKNVKVEMNGTVTIGKALAVDQSGQLLMISETGQNLTIHAGEVSVRGLYGYVD